jgi:hypothetical protein
MVVVPNGSINRIARNSRSVAPAGHFSTACKTATAKALTTWQGANYSRETNNRNNASNSEAPETLETTVTKGTSSSWEGNNSRY